MNQPFRYWPARAQIVLGLVVATAFPVGQVVVRTVMGDDFWETVLKVAPAAAVLVALMTLVVTTTGSLANWKRQRREATIHAWSEWSNSNFEGRRAISKLLGEGMFPEEVGRALVDKAAIKIDGYDLDEDQIKHASKTLVLMLNGLERLAVGVETAVYDLPTLRSLGGTIIIREYERATNYVHVRRKAKDAGHRQAKVFVALEQLCGDMHRLANQDATRAIDHDRLKYLRQLRR